jgi:hypothetical protein
VAAEDSVGSRRTAWGSLSVGEPRRVEFGGGRKKRGRLMTQNISGKTE